MLNQDKSNITEIVMQKDALISKFQDEISIYKWIKLLKFIEHVEIKNIF